MKNITTNTTKICAGMISFLAFSGIGFGSAPSSSSVALPGIHDHQNPKWTPGKDGELAKAVCGNPNKSSWGLAGELYQGNIIPGRTQTAIHLYGKRIAQVFGENENLRPHIRALFGIKEQCDQDLRRVRHEVSGMPANNGDNLPRYKLEIYQKVAQAVVRAKPGDSNESIVARIAQHSRSIRHAIRDTPELLSHEKLTLTVNLTRAVLGEDLELAERLRIELVAPEEEKEALLATAMKNLHDTVRGLQNQSQQQYYDDLDQEMSNRDHAGESWTENNDDRTLIVTASRYVQTFDGVNFYAPWNKDTLRQALKPMGRTVRAMKNRCSLFVRAYRLIFGTDPWGDIRTHGEAFLDASPNPADFRGERGSAVLKTFIANGRCTSRLNLVRQEIQEIWKEGR
jgi:hypothetical protein